MKKLTIIFAVIISILYFFSCKQKSLSNFELAQIHGKSFLLDSIKRYDSLSFIFSKRNDSLSCLYADKSLGNAIQLNTKEGYIIAYTAKANSFLYCQKDSAFFYFTSALNMIDRSDTTMHKYLADLLYNLAILYMEAENYSQTVILLDSSIKMAKKYKNFPVLSLALSEYGALQFNILDSSRGRKYYDSAFQIAKKHSLFREMGVTSGNIAKLENDPVRIIDLSKQAIKYLKMSNSGEDALADLYINIGVAQEIPDSSLFYLTEGLNLAKKGHFTLEEIAAYNNMAYCYLDKNKAIKAENCLVHKAIPLAESVKNYDWLSTLYDSYADVLCRRGKFMKAVLFEKKSIEAKLIADKQKAAGQIRLLDAMLNIKNKEVIINRKDQELLVHRSHEQHMQLWIVFGSIGIFIILLLFIVLQLRTRLQLQRQKIGSAHRIFESEENEKRKIAMELHDIAGQFTMDILGSIENTDIHDPSWKQKLTKRIDDLSENVRSLSHRLSRINIERYDIITLMKNLCYDIREKKGLNIQLTTPDNFPVIPNEIKLHIFRILQELLTNAVKFAQKSSVKVNITYQENMLTLEYTDNGPGFHVSAGKEKGMGLVNIFERSNLLGGKTFLDSTPGYGVYWKISVPLHK